MCRAPPLAGQVQGHGRERRPRVSVPDGFIAPAGPRRAQGAGTPTKERAGVLHELLCDAGWGVSVSACTWWGGGWGTLLDKKCFVIWSLSLMDLT